MNSEGVTDVDTHDWIGYYGVARVWSWGEGGIGPYHGSYII